MLASVSAIVADVSWDFDNAGVTSKTITQGESAQFYVDIFTMEPPIKTTIQLYDSSYNLLHTFEQNKITNDYSYYTYPIITSSMYNNQAGNYVVVVIYGDNVQTFTEEINLRVNSNTVPDTNAPTITRLGSSPVYHEVGTTYTDTGATAYDIEDGDITSDIVVTGSVNSNIIGTYVLRYNVQDAAGNAAPEVRRTVYVRDTTAPVITLNGANPQTINLGDSYTELGATVTDNYDSNLNVQITGTVNTNVEGTYTVRYNAVDSSGNSAQEVRRTVYVVDQGTGGDEDAPIITVIAPTDGSTYTNSELTFQVTVNEESSVSYRLDGGAEVGMTETSTNYFRSQVDLSDGSHSVTFYATDLAGNTAQVTVDFSIDSDNGDDDDDDDDYDDYNYDLEHGTDYYNEIIYLDQYKPKKVIDLTDEGLAIKLKWWQRLINWIVGLFGGEAVY